MEMSEESPLDPPVRLKKAAQAAEYFLSNIGDMAIGEIRVLALPNSVANSFLYARNGLLRL